MKTLILLMTANLALTSPLVAQVNAGPAVRATEIQDARRVSWLNNESSERFAEMRSNHMAFFRKFRGDLLVDVGPDADAIVAEAEKEYLDFCSEHPGQSDQQLFKAYVAVRLPAAQLLEEIDRHREIVADALVSESIPFHLAFKPWEFDLHSEISSIIFTAESIGAEIFTGIQITTASGKRFDGRSHGRPDRRLIVVLNPARQEQIQTIIDKTPGRHETRRTIFSLQTGALISDENL